MSAKRLTLAYQGLSEIPAHVTQQGSEIEELDLTNNKISDLRFLMDFPKLSTLILDRNGVTAQIKFPGTMRSLETLWVNHNKITNLSTFVSTISKYCPKIKLLSMMNNEAAPSYFNGGSYQQYMDYRYYVISQLPRLEVLDDKKIEENEREEALRIYKRAAPVGKTRKRSSSKRKQNLTETLTSSAITN